jgi:hypothetical protein
MVRRPGGRREPAIAAALWAACYVALGLTGERLSTRVLEAQWQLLPLDILRDDPVGSVWHLHAQPPLWNLLVGVLARWSPLSLALSVQVVMLASGCVVAWCIAGVLRSFGLRPGPSLVVTALATLNSTVLLNAFRPQYELPVAAMLAALVWLATRSPGTRSRVVLLSSSAVMTALVLTRSLYHPVLIPVVLLLLWHVHRPHLDRRAVLVAAAIPVVLVGGWMVKNQVLFDRATLASWDGMNLLRSVAPALSDDARAGLRADGSITLPDGSFLPLADYEASVGSCTPSHGHDAVVVPSRPFRTDDDAVAAVEEITNFNHECFLPVYDTARSDALAMIRAEPDRWLLARAWSVNNWIELPMPPTSSPLSTAVRKLSTVVLVGVDHPGLPPSWPEFWVNHWTWTLTIPLASLLVVVAAVRRLRRLRSAPTPAAAGLVLAALLLVWTFAVGVTFELGEQARFRVPVDPLVLAFAGALVLGWWERRRRAVTPMREEPASSSVPRPQVFAAIAIVLAGLGLVAVREGTPPLTVVDADTAAAQIAAISPTTTTTPTATTAPFAPTPVTADPSTTTSTPRDLSTPISASSGADDEVAVPVTVPAVVAAPAPAATVASPSCRLVVHLGDSNLGMTLRTFEERYDALGVGHIVDFANGRGADIAVDGTTAREVIASTKAATDADGRCWVIALGGADAVEAERSGTDPAPTVRAIADAVGGEPLLWVPPILASATTEWNLTASTTYNVALRSVVGDYPSITVFDWPALALEHLDQFQADGIHYTRELYDLYVSSIVGAASDRWGWRR